MDTSHSIRTPSSHNMPQVTTRKQYLYRNCSASQFPACEEKAVKDADEYIALDDTCPVFQLMPRKDNATTDNTLCKRADFVPGSCRSMKKLFKGIPANCSHQPKHIICEIKDYNPKKPHVFCHSNACKKFSPVFIGLYRSETGQYAWYKLNSTMRLEFFINSELLVDFQVRYSHKGYCLIRCINENGKIISQLLILPPILHYNSQELRKNQNYNLLNVNILLLDSVSRHHFYRTLPKTIKEFRSLNEKHFKSGQVFDFELVQGIKGRTFESLQALFGGDVTPLPMFDAFELPPTIINLNETFGKFKAHGYETLYVEDMCWMGEWGLVKEQRAINLSASLLERVQLFYDAINRAGIDRLDVSYSSCLILQENKVTDVFLGPPSVCYNGIHQHTYLLQYLQYFLTRFSSLHKPTFTFLILDTGHEDTGIRIKQIDDNLAWHVSFLAHQQNTVSFILSDHGNTYGHFVQESPESQVEIFHPFLFVIVPDEASKIIGERKMKALHINQNRLISLLDVHYTLKGLLPSNEQKMVKFPKNSINIDGLLSPVSSLRTCKDIPRMHPNICICQASNILQNNNSYYALFAEFALGYMNSQILEMQNEKSKRTCPMLIATRFDNVKKSAQKELSETTISLDLYVKSASMADHAEERFSVSILYSFSTHMEGMIFLGFNRLTHYSIYKQCADPSVDLRLCICERRNVLVNASVRQNRDNSITETVLWTRTYILLVHTPCLYLLTRNYTAGVVLSISNTCSDMLYNIKFNFSSKNLYSSNKMPVYHAIGAKSEKMLVIGIHKLHSKPWKYKYSLDFKAFKTNK